MQKKKKKAAAKNHTKLATKPSNSNISCLIFHYYVKHHARI